jgi:enoyl-CoA hydratase/carnithine racemase
MTESEEPFSKAVMNAITLEQHENVALLRLNKPDQRNALDMDMFRALQMRFDSFITDTATRAVILTGSGNSFCSGAHHSTISDQANLDDCQRRRGIKWVYDLLLSARRCPLPVITAINGHAIAAGAVLGLSGDMVVASSQAKIGLGFVKLGLYPAVGATWWLPKLVGRYKAFEILALGDVMTAEQAFEVGLLNKVVPSESLEKEAMNLAKRLAAGPPMAIGRIKSAMVAAESSSLEGALNLDVEHQSSCDSSMDLSEGLKALLEKRDPVFQGK